MTNVTKVPPCDRCVALGEAEMCQSDIRVDTLDRIYILSQNARFDYCETVADVVEVASGLNWVDYSEGTYADQTYCFRWVSLCNWNDHYFTVPAVGHELLFSPVFIEALRSREIRTWNLNGVLDPQSEYNAHNYRRALPICLGCWENGTSCDDCGQRYQEGYEWNSINDGDSWVCDSCYDRYGWCDEHETYYREGDECRNCEYDSRNGAGFIHSYGYKPDPEFTTTEEESENWAKRSSLDLFAWRRGRKYHIRDDFGQLIPVNAVAKPMVFLGFELEVEAANGSLADGAKLVGEGWSDFLYLKQDGSLNHGMEIVSHPLTLRAHKQLIDWSFLDKLSELGFLSFRTQTCGLHVHVNRASFDSDTHMYKFGKLFADNPVSMQRLGGRDSSRWGTFSNLGEGLRSGVKHEYGLNRYQAVNFQNNTTLELRFFKGTLRGKRVMCALELADAAVEYTRQLSTSAVIKDGGVKFSQLAKWVEGKPQYENLSYFINTFGLLGSEDSSWTNHEISNEMEV